MIGFIICGIFASFVCCFFSGDEFSWVMAMGAAMISSILYIGLKTEEIYEILKDVKNNQEEDADEDEECDEY